MHTTTTMLHAADRNRRPTGTAPFVIMRNIREWVDHETNRKPGDAIKKKPCNTVTEKADGFQVVLDKSSMDSEGRHCKLTTKKGFEYNPKSNGRLGAIGRHIRNRFPKVVNARIMHHKAGRGYMLYGEVTNHTPGSGDNLRALMHDNVDKLDPNRLCIFNVDFQNSKVRIPYAEKLDILRETLGPAHVVRTLIDTRRPVTEQHLSELEDFMCTNEGIVVDNRKHKTTLPVPLNLVAVGFTNVESVEGKVPVITSVPTHFAWAIETGPMTYTVVLIDNKGHLCVAEREAEGKMYINPKEFIYDRVNGIHVCKNKTFAGENYSALLAMAQNTIKADQYATHTAVVKGYTYVVDKSRKDNFDSAEFRFIDPRSSVDTVGVVGANRLWVGRNGGVGTVHFQAPQFLASKDYGHPIHMVLIPGHDDPDFPKPAPFSAEKLLHAASIDRDTRQHARILYGYDADLVYGEYIGEYLDEDVSTPTHSTPEQSEDEEDRDFRERHKEYEIDFRKRSHEYDSLPSKRRKETGLEEWSSVL